MADDTAPADNKYDDLISTVERRERRPPMRGRDKWLLILISIIMMGVLRTGFVFLVVGMMPSIIAYFIDVTRQRYVFHSVFACNLAGLMGFMTKIIAHGPSSALLQEMMGSLTTWFTIYAAATMGWLATQLCPIIAMAIIQNVHLGQIFRIKHMQKKLEAEWGPEVTQLSGSAHKANNQIDLNDPDHD